MKWILYASLISTVPLSAVRVFRRLISCMKQLLNPAAINLKTAC